MKVDESPDENNRLLDCITKKKRRQAKPKSESVRDSHLSIDVLKSLLDVSSGLRDILSNQASADQFVHFRVLIKEFELLSYSFFTQTVGSYEET